jgi:RNA polymerase primary sigma factor
MAATLLEVPRTIDNQMTSYQCETTVPARDRPRYQEPSRSEFTHGEEPGPSDAELAALSAVDEEAFLARDIGQPGGSDGSGDVFRSYIQDIRSIGRLTHTEERLLAKRSEAGDQRARRRLVEANLRLVIAYAQWYMKSGVPLADLIQEGNLGLMRAAEKFDWRRGCHFSTYATWWIRQAIRHAASEQSRLIHVPANVAMRVGKLRRMSSQMSQETGVDPTQAELAQAVGMPLEEVKDLMRLTDQPTSLDVPIDVERGLLLSDTLEDAGIESPEESASEHVLSDEVSEALLQLTSRERSAVILRFGIGDGQNRTLLEVGNQLGISRERARRLIETGLDKLRAETSIQMLLGSQ